MKANYPWDKEQNVGLFCRKAKTFFALKSESGAHTLATELESHSLRQTHTTNQNVGFKSKKK